MSKKKKYTKPSINIRKFDKEDVIRATGPGPGPFPPNDLNGD